LETVSPVGKKSPRIGKSSTSLDLQLYISRCKILLGFGAPGGAEEGLHVVAGVARVVGRAALSDEEVEVGDVAELEGAQGQLEIAVVHVVIDLAAGEHLDAHVKAHQRSCEARISAASERVEVVPRS
jgi:hypothetical protein